MRKKKQHTTIFLMFFLLSGILINAAVTAADYSKAPILVAHLSGNQMVPQVPTSSQGKVVFQLSDKRVSSGSYSRSNRRPSHSS